MSAISDPSESFITIMLPAAKYAGCFFVYYWVCHYVCLMVLPFFKKSTKESFTFYSKKLGLTKKNLSIEKQQEIALKYFQNFFVTSILSVTHALIMGYLLIPFALNNYSVLLNAEISTTFQDPAVYQAMYIFTGYVLNDFIFMFPYAVEFKLSDDIMFIAHHVTLIFTWTSFLTDGWGHLFAVPTMLTELTSPFVFVRWVLNEFRMITGNAFLFNGIFLLIFWYTFRIFGYTFFLSFRLLILRNEIFHPDHLIRNSTVLACHILGCFLQLNWGYLLTMGALKTLGYGQTKPKVEKKN